MARGIEYALTPYLVAVGILLTLPVHDANQQPHCGCASITRTGQRVQSPLPEDKF